METKEKQTYNVQEAIKAHRDYLKKYAKEHPEDWMTKEFKEGRGFAPADGRCWCCGKNIYELHGNSGISVEQAGKEIITGCPHCYRSYVD